MKPSKEFSFAPGSEKDAWSIAKAAAIGSLLNIDGPTDIEDFYPAGLRDPERRHDFGQTTLKILSDDYDKKPDFYDKMTAEEYIENNFKKAAYRRKIYEADHSIKELDQLIDLGETGIREHRFPHLDAGFGRITESVKFGILDENLDEYGIYKGEFSHNGDRLAEWEKLKNEDSFNKSPHDIVDLQLAMLNSYRAQFVLRKKELEAAIIDLENPPKAPSSLD